MGKLTFQIYKGDQLLRTETLFQPVIKIGSLPSSHLRLDDDMVSRMHAVIEVTAGGEVQIIDLGSTAGTVINGQKINKATLQTGDVVLMGNTKLIVAIGDTTPPSRIPAPHSDANNKEPPMDDELARMVKQLAQQKAKEQAKGPPDIDDVMETVQAVQEWATLAAQATPAITKAILDTIESFRGKLATGDIVKKLNEVFGPEVAAVNDWAKERVEKNALYIAQVARKVMAEHNLSEGAAVQIALAMDKQLSESFRGIVQKKK